MARTASPAVAPHEALHALTGTWHNQLGSRLVIETDGGGGLSGHYSSGTGAMAGSSYRLVGTYEPNPQTRVMVLGFVVDWTEAHAVTAWSGQYHHDDRTIRATWLMTTETEEGDEWKSTFVGQDVFRRDDNVATIAAGVSPIP
jgi:hypothetical protein